MIEKRGQASPRRRRTRRYAFLGLLLVALSAPIGWVAASVPNQSYVVLFNDAAVTVPAEAPPMTGPGASFVQVAAAHPRPVVSAVAADSNGSANRRVDSGRVAGHVQDIAARNGVGDIEDVYSAAVGGFSARLNAAQSAAIAADPSVAAVIPDEWISDDDITAGLHGPIRTTSNPTDRVQPGVRRVGARTSTVAAMTAGGLKVDADVAIIDTGIDRNHPDLNVVGGYNCTSRNRDKWDDDEGHGTHVAGIVGAMDNRIGVTGVAPGVRLWSVKVLDSTGHGFVSWLICGVDWVTAQRDPHNPSRPLIEVANMSLTFSMPGGDDSNCGRNNGDALHMAICRSTDKGITYVVAAGNESQSVRRVRPAAYDEVITVSALADYDGRGGGHGYPSESCPYWSPEPDDAFTSFSNYGPEVDLIAPGKCILSTYLNGRYAWMSGTSMATPHVTGAAVIYKTLFPRATPAQVRMALEAVGTFDWKTHTDPDTVHEPAVWIGQFRAMPDFAISTSLTSSATASGSTLPLKVSLTRVGGFNDAVTVSLLNPPAGISATPIVTRGSQASLALRVDSKIRLGTYSVTVQAAAPDVTHNQVITIVVRGSEPQAGFISPSGALTVQSDTAVAVSWTERGGGAATTARRLDRQVASIRVAGTCDGASYTTDLSHANATDLTDHVRSGYCYRWALTLTDSAGYRSTAYSGAVLVDTSAPRAPSVTASADAAHVPDVGSLGLGPVYVAPTGVVWVRAGATGTVPLQVNASDPESGIARNTADVSGTGWRADWTGSSTNGALRVIYAAQSAAGILSVSSVNGAGLAGPSRSVTLARDSSAPSAPTWVTASSGSTRTIRGTYFRLDWTSATDLGAGIASQQIVARYRANLNADGTCRTNAFVGDGGFRLATDNSWDSGLAPSSCYVWSLRSVDNVGNTSSVVVSGYVITEPAKQP